MSKFIGVHTSHEDEITFINPAYIKMIEKYKRADRFYINQPDWQSIIYLSGDIKPINVTETIGEIMELVRAVS